MLNAAPKMDIAPIAAASLRGGAQQSVAQTNKGKAFGVMAATTAKLLRDISAQKGATPAVSKAAGVSRDVIRAGVPAIFDTSVKAANAATYKTVSGPVHGAGARGGANAVTVEATRPKVSGSKPSVAPAPKG